MEWNNDDLTEENEEYAVKISGLTVRYRMPSEKIDGIKEYLDKIIAHKLEHKEFVALKNVDLMIRKGERIGIIGHNGAGKSTLLKIIAHVIKPSEGTVTVTGSIAPLLELGAGFDLELSGVENIYLNGSILGRSKRYLDSVKDDIIEFAELGEFINYSVKNYSSGMRAKLGFAVATQVDSDILLVDEVFGVGDENFKRKSKEKMVQMINSGKTVIIVSHDMTQIVDLTDRAIWMHNGEIIEEGDPQEICDKYCDYMLKHQNVVIEHRKAKPVKKAVRQKKRRTADTLQEYENKNTVSKWAQKLGVLDKILNDPLAIDKLVYDRRILKRIQNNDDIIEKAILLPRGLELIADNDELLYDLFQNKVVMKKIAENPYLVVKPEKPAHNIRGKIDECKYYKADSILYLKGWYMPINEYTNVKIYVGGEEIGEACCHLSRTGAGKGSSNPLDSFSGWEFAKQIMLSTEKAEVVVYSNKEVVVMIEQAVEIVEKECSEKIRWKSKNRFSEKECLELYQKYFLGGFNLISSQMRRKYNALFQKYSDIGYLFRKGYKSIDRELGFDLQINRLGLRGPCDQDANYVILGNGNGMGLSVDEDKAWFADECFAKGWINLSFVCGPKQLKKIINDNLDGNFQKKVAIVIYEASFWNVNSEDINNKKRLDKDWDNYFVEEKRDFLDFYNKMHEGIWRKVKDKYDLFINCNYAKFDYGSNSNVIDYIIEEWIAILDQFSKVVVMRLPNKEYIYGEKKEGLFLHSLKEEQDFGWELLKKEFRTIENINFIEMNDFCLSDFCVSLGCLNRKGNIKLRKWIKMIKKMEEVYNIEN